MKFLDIPEIPKHKIRFAYWPTRMSSGMWVWLEPYYSWVRCDECGSQYFYTKMRSAYRG